MQVDGIKKTFNHDSNYDWMIETEKRTRSDKTILAKLKAENAEA